MLKQPQHAHECPASAAKPAGPTITSLIASSSREGCVSGIVGCSVKVLSEERELGLLPSSGTEAASITMSGIGKEDS